MPQVVAEKDCGGYWWKQFVYLTREECVANFFNLGLTVAGMFMLGFTHVLIGLGMFALERTVKQNVEALEKIKGVSGIYCALAGYLVGSWWLGKSVVYLLIGGVVLLQQARLGLTQINMIAHALPAVIGFLIAIVARRWFRVK